MAWQLDYPFFPFHGMEPRLSFDSLPVNEQCFIRKEHKCGKLFGASKSCFIASPTDDDLEPILALMSEKLMKVGIEPIVAVKERAYGQDIFCTKICGKIIESRFCIVILDDTINNGTNIPNPNVYYEYGLMTSLRKHIIPLQKENLELAFNIQSYDTIKYNPKNVASELDRAIKDAIRITEAKEKDDKRVALPEKALLRKLELAGFDLRSSEWFLHDAIGDTNFKGFGQYDKRFYLYLGKVDDTAELQDYLDDLGVVLYRTEKKASDLEEKLSSLKENLKALKMQMKKEKNELLRRGQPPRYSLTLTASLERVESSITDAKDKISLMSTVFIGFVVNPQIDASEFLFKAEELVQQYDRYKLSLSSEDSISFGDSIVHLAIPGH